MVDINVLKPDHGKTTLEEIKNSESSVNVFIDHFLNIKEDGDIDFETEYKKVSEAIPILRNILP